MRFFKGFLIGLLLLLVASNFSLATDPASEIKLDIKEFHLKNGILFLWSGLLRLKLPAV